LSSSTTRARDEGTPVPTETLDVLYRTSRGDRGESAVRDREVLSESASGRAPNAGRAPA
jgi:hypothetical protein